MKTNHFFKILGITLPGDVVDAINKNEEICNGLEIHADGVKDVPCEFCEISCNNTWCYTKEKEQ